MQHGLQVVACCDHCAVKSVCFFHLGSGGISQLGCCKVPMLLFGLWGIADGSEKVVMLTSEASALQSVESALCWLAELLAGP